MVLEATEPLLTTLLQAIHEVTDFYTPLYNSTQHLDAIINLQPLRTALPNQQQRQDLFAVFILLLLGGELKSDYKFSANDWELPPMTFPETANLQWLARLTTAKRLERSCADRMQDLLTGFTERHVTLGKGHLHPADVAWAAGAGADMLSGMKTKFGVDLRHAVVENKQLAATQGWLHDRQVFQSLLDDNAEVKTMFAGM